MRVLFLNIIIMIAFITGCGPENYREEMNDLLSEKSDYYREIRKNGYLIKVNYLPIRFFELRHLITLNDTTTREQKNYQIAAADSLYGNGLYFMVTIGFEDKTKDIMNENIGNFPAWSDNLQKFYFRMDEYIYLQTAMEEEIKLSVYDFQNTFGMTKDRKMLLCFPKTFNDKSILDGQSEFVKMCFREFGFGIGRQHVEWDIDDLI